MPTIPKGFAESDVPAESAPSSLPDPPRTSKCLWCKGEFELDKGYNPICCSEKCYRYIQEYED